MSPAPIVMTTSPSRTNSLSAAARSVRDPCHTTGRPASFNGTAIRSDVTPGIGCARRLKCGCDFCGMMGVIIYDRYSRDVAETLKSAIDSTELNESFAHRVDGHTERQASTNRGKGVLNVVVAGYAERDVAEVRAVVAD